MAGNLNPSNSNIKVSPVRQRLNTLSWGGFGFLQSQAKVNELHPEWLRLMIDQHDVVHLQVCVDHTNTPQGS